MSDALNPLYMSVTMGIHFKRFWFGFIENFDLMIDASI